MAGEKRNAGSQPVHGIRLEGRDIMVPMRDGKRVAVDIYRPDSEGRFPALLSFAGHNKFLQGQEVIEACGNQPAWSPLWCGPAEGGDSRYFASRGYVHVIGNMRGFGNSDSGNPLAEGKTDAYDLIEWMAAQPWCDGNIGMVGISWFGVNQMVAAMTQPPHLKAIFPMDPGNFSFRDIYPGGVLHSFWLHLLKFDVGHPHPHKLPPEAEPLWKAAFDNPDYRMYSNLFNVLERRGNLATQYFWEMLNPYEAEDQSEVEAAIQSINIPMTTGSGWYAYTYKCHLFGSTRAFQTNRNSPMRRLRLGGPAHRPRPWNDFHDEVVRWYDYWLKGIDTGVADDPPVKVWTMGANRWRTGTDWPLPETHWTKLYLDTWERLRWEPFAPGSNEGVVEPDAFAQMPLKLTRTVQCLRYLTPPLAEDVEVTGPLSLHFWAAIDQEDTNWIITIKDVGPDVSVQSAREGELERPDVPEREVTRGWLKASHRALDAQRSRPGQPWHPFTRSAQERIVPGLVYGYDVEIAPTSNLFQKNHRICVEIAAMDVPTGIGGDAAVEYIPYHICSSRTVMHKVYRDQQHPSHLLIPVIPKA